MQYINQFSNYRKLIAGIDTKVPLSNSRYSTAINFDNAATTPPLLPVLEEIIKFSPWYASVHRGAGYKSQYSSQLYEDARSIVADYVGANLTHHTVIFVKNTTEAINKLSNRLLSSYGDAVVLSTCMEHHSNDLPWRNKYQVDYIDIDQEGKLSIEDLQEKLRQYRGKVKLVTITGASNVTGYKNPIHEIAQLVHEYGAEILVDGAQLVPHAPVNMKSPDDPRHIDYLAFSGHKMYAPFGTGVLIGSKKAFKKGAPDYTGGGTVQLVTHQHIQWLDPPLKEEAGTQNVMGVVAMSKAIKILKDIGMEEIEDYERGLTAYTLKQLSRLPHLQLYVDRRHVHDRVSIIPFNIKDMPHDLVANILSQEAGIAVRSGCFCAHPYIQRLLNVPQDEMQKRIEDPTLPHPGVVRVSYGFYNTYQEIDILINTLHKILNNKKALIEKYQNNPHV
ncbi:Selenocysteine lyase/Cysteine desulfurase [Anaerovirgula multivorans]|uniref:Selenocysteine lyase/Cysteine desulfurase n=1 Tax=Anaerovirgula multivorans TaxID=312168 RepID=A0A239GE70_9FIRM|nr:aminotransferase class V-fold PLP-dependent enzyme [Anaerovirgula multivorans]SNS67032.1 Selenocysteine lyase/Cysteine desulfurase [Anaerovirgula multivorans]